MPFNTALSGLRAASKDLSVTGNNIANASTTGFKSSRAEFGDLYASSVLGSGANAAGSGVRLQDVAQNFKEGNISFTENNLDLAISGSGFFMLNHDGEQSYSRAGTFGLDDTGHIVNNAGARLQGFPADDTGSIGQLRGDLRIQTSNLAPRQTTHVASELNLDASESVLQRQGTTFETTGDLVGQALLNTGNNGYTAQSITITGPDGATTSYQTDAYESAAYTAADLNAVAGVSATARSTMQVSGSLSGATQVVINGQTLDVDSLAALEQKVNDVSQTGLAGVTASLNGGVLTVSSSVGEDLNIAITNGLAAGDSLEVTAGGSTQALTNGGDEVTVGGSLSVVLEEGYSVTSADTELFGDLSDPNAFQEVTINAFNPGDPETYNSATSMMVHDSLGNPHVMTQYFVRQNYNPDDATTVPNHWRMYLQIDGRDVGDPTLNGGAPGDAPTMAGYDLYFDQSGALNEELSDDVLVSNWTPVDANGQPNGARGPQTVVAGGSTLIQDPPSSSNFVIDLGGTTQFNDDFGEYNVTQDGYTTGRLSALNIDEQGLIFARFTNGQSQALGQITLAKFTNEQGLEPTGDSMWSESADSGQPNVGIPGSSDLGAIQSGALEESNVDLSAQLVNLIIAQRNFQANAKTIETADQTTQTIINLR